MRFLRSTPFRGAAKALLILSFSAASIFCASKGDVKAAYALMGMGALATVTLTLEGVADYMKRRGFYVPPSAGERPHP